jgi:hypothetical protein
MELRPRKAPRRKQSLSGSIHSPVLSYFQSSIANLMKILRTRKENNRKFAIDLLETGMGSVWAMMVRNVLMCDINLNTFFETPMRPSRECFDRWPRHQQKNTIRKNRGLFNEKESQLAFTTNRLGWDESFLPDSNRSLTRLKKFVAKRAQHRAKGSKLGGGCSMGLERLYLSIPVGCGHWLPGLAGRDAIRAYFTGWFSAKMAMRSSSMSYWLSLMNEVHTRMPSWSLPVFVRQMALTP